MSVRVRAIKKRGKPIPVDFDVRSDGKDGGKKGTGIGGEGDNRASPWAHLPDPYFVGLVLRGKDYEGEVIGIGIELEGGMVSRSMDD